METIQSDRAASAQRKVLAQQLAAQVGIPFADAWQQIGTSQPQLAAPVANRGVETVTEKIFRGYREAAQSVQNRAAPGARELTDSERYDLEDTIADIRVQRNCSYAEARDYVRNHQPEKFGLVV